METRVCKQCGERKPIENFRKYYGGRTGSYRTCKYCEKINMRYKYLAGKATLSREETLEVSKIQQLWSLQRELGYQPPNTGRTRDEMDLDSDIERYSTQLTIVRAAVSQPIDVVVPQELQRWLTEPLTSLPEYYQDTVYEELKARYRPVLRIDTSTNLPVHDDTYRQVLQDILRRFDDYEEEYYKGEDDSVDPDTLLPHGH